MAVLNFITTNRSKIRSLQGALDGYDVEVKTRGLDLLEPQYDTVNEVSAFKARQAFERLREPVLVEDGGFVAEALNGFPGVYTKYALATIGAKGILNLLSGESNRRARFISCASYIDEEGQLYQFEREGNLEMEVGDKLVDIDSPYAWSELWTILYVPRLGKTMCELNAEEVKELYGTVRGSLQVFAAWYVKRLHQNSAVA